MFARCRDDPMQFALGSRLPSSGVDHRAGT